jgi:glycerol kinase
VEHEPEEIWASVVDAVGGALAAAGVSGEDIGAIGITNQRETAVLWERASGKPVYRAIVWQDRRTSDRCAELEAAGHAARVREATGLVIDPYFSGTKVAWLLDNVAGLRRRAVTGELAFGTIDSFLVHRLTGGVRHVTDVTNASRTLLMDLRERRWHPGMCELFGVPEAVLPEIAPSAGTVGQTRGLPMLPDGIPVSGMAGDQHAALFGQACFEPGEAKCTYGTGAFVLVNTGDRPIASRFGLLSTIGWQIGSEVVYALEGSSFIAGAAVQWLRDGLGIIKSSAEVERLAATVTDNGGVYLVPAFTGVGSPHWDPYARGMIHGLTRGATAGHIARAALESIAYQAGDVLHAMESDSGIRLAELRVDGGAARNDMLMQFQADLLGVPVVRPRITETTALGAAYLAGLAVGYWQDAQEIAAQWQAERGFEPRMDRAHAEALMGGWRKALERAKNWAEQ